MSLTEGVKTVEKVLKEAGFDLYIAGDAKGVQVDDWKTLEFSVTLMYKGVEVWHGPYRMGLGHVDLEKVSLLAVRRMGRDEESMYHTWMQKPTATFKNTALQLRVAEIAAKDQNLKPKIADILYCILMDGSAYFNDETFTEWAEGFGYSPDSIKASEIYDTCIDTGRNMVRVLGREFIEQLQEDFQDY